jgi:hypothetical protein
LKKKRKKETHLAYLSARWPSSPLTLPPRQPTAAISFSFFFLSLTTRPHRLAAPFTFLSSSPPPLPRPIWCRRDPRRGRPLPFPFLLARAGQLRRHFLAFKSSHFPFPPLLPNMPAAFNDKSQPPLVPSASLPFPLSRLLLKVELELLLAPLLSHCKHTRLSIPFTIAAASVRPPPPCHRRRW